MTVKLGRGATSLFDRLDQQTGGAEPPDAASFERDWIARRNRVREAMTRRDHPTWPVAPCEDRTLPVSEPIKPDRFAKPQSGMVGLYADRVRRQPPGAVAMHRVSTTERAVVGGRLDPTQRRRSLAVLGQTRSLGRGSDAHLAALYPGRRPAYRRLRLGSLPEQPILRLPAPSLLPWPDAMPGLETLRGLVAPLAGGYRLDRLNAPRRMIVASIAVLILLASAASTSLAGQGRYEVQPGDTIDSIATAFGVDPDAIRAASYLPTGDALAAGQVLVIPEPGQTPEDAARMAAEREGTSPWVSLAHIVGEGETVSSIAADYGVSGEAIIDVNGIADPANLLIGTRLLIPAGGDVAAVAPDSAGPAVSVPNVPAYRQSRNLSCEYAAAFIATSAFGAGVSETTFLASVPQASNPHYGYRGNIDGWWGNTTDYGIYAEPLVPVLNEWGFAAEVMYTAGDVGPLIAHLDAGHPVLVWLGLWGDTREVLDDEGTYAVFAGMHVVTAYGYSDAGVWVSDPATASYRLYGWDEFAAMWSVVDGMGLAVYPY